MTKKNKIILLIIGIVIILLIPIRTTLDDGGTVVYNSLTYKIIDWHEENITYIEGYKTGRNVYLFPNNFKTVKYYSDLDAAERERNFGVANVIDSGEECSSKEKELFHTENEFEYYYECHKSQNITVVFNDKSTMSLNQAINEGLFDPDLLGVYDIDYQMVNTAKQAEKEEEKQREEQEKNAEEQ